VTGPASETELEASYVELEEEVGEDRHYCSVVEGDMSSADGIRGAPNEEPDMGLSNRGWKLWNLHE